MKSMFRIILLFTIVLSGCATVDPDRLNAFHTANPSSILIVPVVNDSTDVMAPTSVLATLPFSLAEHGYYTFPVNTVKTVLEAEGYYEPAEVHAAPPESLAELFGADAILYVAINEWTSKYMLFSTTTEVDFDYRIVSADGSELWKANKRLAYTPQNNSSGNPLADLIASAITAAIERASPNYLPLTRRANNEVFYGPNVGLPPGPHNPSHKEYYKALDSSDT